MIEEYKFDEDADTSDDLDQVRDLLIWLRARDYLGIISIFCSSFNR